MHYYIPLTKTMLTSKQLMEILRKNEIFSEENREGNFNREEKSEITTEQYENTRQTSQKYEWKEYEETTNPSTNEEHWPNQQSDYDYQEQYYIPENNWRKPHTEKSGDKDILWENDLPTPENNWNGEEKIEHVTSPEPYQEERVEKEEFTTPEPYQKDRVEEEHRWRNELSTPEYNWNREEHIEQFTTREPYPEERIEEEHRGENELSTPEYNWNREEQIEQFTTREPYPEERVQEEHRWENELSTPEYSWNREEQIEQFTTREPYPEERVEEEHRGENELSTPEYNWNREEHIEQFTTREPYPEERVEEEHGWRNEPSTPEYNFNEGNYANGDYHNNENFAGNHKFEFSNWNETHNMNNSFESQLYWRQWMQNQSSQEYPYPGYQQNYYYNLHYRNRSFPSGEYNHTAWNEIYGNGYYPYEYNGNLMYINTSYNFPNRDWIGYNFSNYPQDENYWYKYYQYYNQTGEFPKGFNRTYYYTMNGSIPQNQYYWYQYQYNNRPGGFPQGFNRSYYYTMNGSIPQNQHYWYQYQYHNRSGEFPQGFNRSYYYTINGSIPQNQYQWYQYRYHNGNGQLPYGYNMSYYYTPNGSIPQYQWYQYRGMEYFPYQNGSYISYHQYMQDQNPLYRYGYYYQNNSIPGNQFRYHMWNTTYYYGNNTPYNSNLHLYDNYFNYNHNKTYYTINTTLNNENYNNNQFYGWIQLHYYYPYQNGSYVSYKDDQDKQNANNHYYYQYNTVYPTGSRYETSRWNRTYDYTINGTIPQYQYFYNISRGGSGYPSEFYPYINGSIISFRDQPNDQDTHRYYYYQYNKTLPSGSPTYQNGRWMITRYNYTINGNVPQYQYSYNISQPTSGYRFDNFYPYENGSSVSYHDYPQGSVYYYQYNTSYPSGTQYYYRRWNAPYSYRVNGNGYFSDNYFPFKNGSIVSYREISGDTGSNFENQNENNEELTSSYDSSPGNQFYSGYMRYTIKPNNQSNILNQNEITNGQQGDWRYYWHRNGTDYDGNGQEGSRYGTYYMRNGTYFHGGSTENGSPYNTWNYSMTYHYPSEENSAGSSTYNNSWITRYHSYSPEYSQNQYTGDYNHFNFSLFRQFNNKSWQYQHPTENSGIWRANVTYTYKFPNGTVVTQHHSGYNNNMNSSSWNTSAHFQRLSSQYVYPTVSNSRAWNISVNYGYFPNGTRYYSDNGNNGGITYTQSTDSDGENGVTYYTQNSHNTGGNGVTYYTQTTHNNGGNGLTYTQQTNNNGMNGVTYYTHHSTSGSGMGSETSDFDNGGTTTYYNGGSGTHTYQTQGGNGKYIVRKTVYTSKPVVIPGKTYSYRRTYYSKGSSRVKRDESSLAPEEVDNEKIIPLQNATSENGTSFEAVNSTQKANITQEVNTTTSEDLIDNVTLPTEVEEPQNETVQQNSTSFENLLINTTDTGMNETEIEVVETNLNESKQLIQTNLTNFNISDNNLKGIVKDNPIFNTTKSVMKGIDNLIFNTTKSVMKGIDNPIFNTTKSVLKGIGNPIFNTVKSVMKGTDKDDTVFNTTKSLIVLNGNSDAAKSLSSNDAIRPQPLKFTLSLSVALDTPEVLDVNSKKKK